MSGTRVERRGPDPRTDGGEQAFREVMGELVTGVCAVTTRAGRGPDAGHDAIVVNSLTSVSLRPQLVSMYLREDSSFLRSLSATGVWAASILPEGSGPVARTLALPADRRPGPELVTGWVQGAATGCLTLPDAPGVIECELDRCVTVGDHVLVVGRVVGLTRRPARPLVFHRGRFDA
ncbi:flavin reductase family protein [Kitasatospora sp. NPDC048540]|uniref:flavin reductase family protein n=1 Tax=unclassified Kitasatospora TaxID=2633591 RepID=UPI00068E65A2|nr:flavin reductase family protein [Kitasatospora sp. MBT63]